MFEDEIEMLKKEKEELEENYVSMRNDYEKEIATIIDNHKS